MRATLLVLILLAGCGSPGPPAPLPLEQLPSERAKLLTIPDEYKVRSNPLPASEANLLEGRARYQEYCAVCHGPDGKGNTVLGRGLYPPAGDLTSPKAQIYTDGQLFWMVSEGVRFSGMPAGRAMHSEEQMWKIVLYLRQFRRHAVDTVAG